MIAFAAEGTAVLHFASIFLLRFKPGINLNTFVTLLESATPTTSNNRNLFLKTLFSPTVISIVSSDLPATTELIPSFKVSVTPDVVQKIFVKLIV